MIQSIQTSETPNFFDWALIPMFAERLERTGVYGLVHTMEEGFNFGRPIFLKETPRPQSETELFAIIEEQNRWKPLIRKPRNSSMDILIDDVLSIRDSLPKTGLKVIDKSFDNRNQVIVNYILEFGQRGEVNVRYIKDLSRALRKVPVWTDIHTVNGLN